MIKLFGKEYQLYSLLSWVIFVLSLIVIFLNVFNFIKFDHSLMNLNMVIGCILLIYSVYNLFIKNNSNR